MAEFFRDFHKTDEILATTKALESLVGIDWARPLLRKVGPDVSTALRSLRFEARFAAELHTANVVANYEHQTGMGQLSVDFRLRGPVEWLIEILSIDISDAAERASEDNDPYYSFCLSSSASDPKMSEEGEMVRASEKIANKVQKFPLVQPKRYHVIIADMRGYIIMGGDRDDYRQIAYGPTAVRSERVHYWKNKPVLGLFETGNSHSLAKLVRERIHILGFVREHRYEAGELRDPSAVYYLPNPHMMTEQQFREAFAVYPMRPLR